MSSSLASEADRDIVVNLLRRNGPRSLTWLREHPDLDAWSKDRTEQAVVRAWSENFLTVDVEDQLVAL